MMEMYVPIGDLSSGVLDIGLCDRVGYSIERRISELMIGSRKLLFIIGCK